MRRTRGLFKKIRDTKGTFHKDVHIKWQSVDRSNMGDPGSTLGWEDSPREGNGNPLKYSCLGNPMDRGAWWATVHGFAKSWAWLNDQYTLGCKAFFLALCFEWDSFTPWVLGLVLCFKLKFTFWLPGLENFFLALFVKRGFSPRGLGWEFFPLGSFEASVFSFWFCFPEGSFSVSWSPLLGLIWLYVLLSSACFLAGMTLLTLIGASVGNWGSAQSCFSETSRFPLLPLILPHSAPSIFPSTPLNPLGFSSGPSILCPPCQTLFLLTLASQALGLVALCLLGLPGDSVMSNSLRPRGL